MLSGIPSAFRSNTLGYRSVFRCYSASAAKKQPETGFRESKIWVKQKSVTSKKHFHVIFVKNTEVGQAGEVMWIRKGYGRNYFFPRNEAVFATTENLIKYKELIDSVDHEAIALDRLRSKYKKKIGKISLIINRHSNSDGRPHAPCYKETIIKYLWRKHNIQLGEDQILLKEPLVNWGEYLIPIDLGLGEPLKLDIIFADFADKSKKQLIEQQRQKQNDAEKGDNSEEPNE